MPATAGLASFVVAWQNQGVLATEIHARFWALSTGFVPETVISDPSLGPTDAGRGLVDGGDVNSDLAVAWVQGSGRVPGSLRPQQYQEPGAPQARKNLAYDAKVRPSVGWNPANDLWGPVAYSVSVDGVQLGATTATSFRIPAPLGQGPHTWNVTATNPAGLSAISPNARIWIDTVRPSLRWRLDGQAQGRPDDPACARLRRRRTGIIGRVSTSRSAGATARVAAPSRRPRQAHAYRRAGRYLVTVMIKDRAGNTSTVARRINIKAH